MCGNGIRCMAKFVADLEQASGSKAYTINTLAGPIKPVLRDDGQVCSVFLLPTSWKMSNSFEETG